MTTTSTSCPKPRITPRRHAAGKRAFGIVNTPAPDAQTRHRVAATIAPTIRGAVGRRQQGVLRYDDSPDVLELVGSTLGREISGIGPATPDHIIQTKRLPLWLECDRPEDIEGLLARLPAAAEQYAEDYRRWHAEHSPSSRVGATPMLDPYPRVVLVPGVGMWTTGRDARASLITGDIYHHNYRRDAFKPKASVDIPPSPPRTPSKRSTGPWSCTSWD